MRAHHIASIAITLFASLHLSAKTDEPASINDYPSIPTAALDRYQVSIVDEQLEMMPLPRMRLTGRKVFQMDTLPGHISMPTQGECSARLVISDAPDFKVEFFAFPVSQFLFPLNDTTLNLHMQGMALRQKPEQVFTILEKSAFTEDGRSKFRILGQRAMTIRYSVQDEDKSITYGENWIERDDLIYIVRVQAPSSTFSLQFEDARVVFNSMHEVQ